jgi:lactate permease
MFTQQLAPLAGSLGLSALMAALPLVTVLILLGVLRVKAHVAAIAGLVVALLVAMAVYRMPIDQALSSAVQGAVFGLFPIMWIVVNALWIYNMTVRTRHFDVLRRSFGRVSDDPRIQGLIVAFCFGALMEALAGFGAPVAISAVMLIALGFSPVRAAVVSLVANTAPVAFGALATPVITLAQVTGRPLDVMSSMVGRQTPVLAIFVPLVLLLLIDGRRGVRELWAPALVCGISFGVAQFLVSNYVTAELSDIGSALAGAAALMLMPHARRTANAEVRESVLTGGAGTSTETVELEERDSRRDIVLAYAPYGIIVAIFAIAQLPGIKPLLAKATISFHWPLLNIVSSAGKAVSGNRFSLALLAAGGTLVLIAGIITAIVLPIGAKAAAREWASTVYQLRFAILTVASVLALAYVMNLSGQTTTIGNFVAGAGAGLAFLSPILGWFGVAVSGSDTSANALFGALQFSAASKAGLSPDLLAAANSSGGVLGKMISPQNLTIACVAAQLPGEEGGLLRKVLPWSLALLLVMCVLVTLQSTSVLGWMLP